MSVELLFGIVGGVVFGLWGASHLARSVRAGRAWQDEVTARWQATAQRLGGGLETPSGGGLAAPRKLRLSAEDDGAVAFAEVTVPTERTAHTHTRAWAPFVIGQGPRFLLSHTTPRRAASWPPRDRLEAPSPEAAHALFTEPARRHAAAFPRPLTLRSSGGVVQAVWDGVELDPRALEAALGLVRELGRASVRALYALRGLDGATLLPREDAAPVLRVRRGPAIVQLSAEVDADRLRYVAWAEPRRALPTLDVSLSEGLPDALPDGVLDPSVVGEAPALGDARLRADAERVELSWDAPPTERQAEAAVRILAPMAKGLGGGAFR